MEPIMEISSPLARLRIRACAPPTLAKSTSPEASAAIAAGPPRIKIGSIVMPCSLKYPLAMAARTGSWLCQERLTNRTRSAFFSCADEQGADKKTTRNASSTSPLFNLCCLTGSPPRSSSLNENLALSPYPDFELKLLQASGPASSGREPYTQRGSTVPAWGCTSVSCWRMIPVKPSSHAPTRPPACPRDRGCPFQQSDRAAAFFPSLLSRPRRQRLAASVPYPPPETQNG